MGIRIKADKRIGRVIFFVEGREDEPVLLRALFCDVLGYQTIVYDPHGQTLQEYQKEGDPYSKVFVIPMPTSALVNAPGDEEFMDEVYRALAQHGLHRDEAAIYYLFDRDRQSNKAAAVKRKISTLRNPYDNGSELPGALLLSYPCVQAYYCLAAGATQDFPNSQEAKKQAKAHGYSRIDSEGTVHAGEALLFLLEAIRGKALRLEELSDYSTINHPVFEYEEKHWEGHNHYYKTLSLLSLALLDLGILSLE